MGSAVVLLSGGMASAVTAYQVRLDRRLHLLHLRTQTPGAAKLHQAASALAKALQAPLATVDWPDVAAAVRPAEADQRPSAVATKRGLSPRIDDALRWASMLSAAAGYATRIGAEAVALGLSAARSSITGETVALERRVDIREFAHACRILLEAALPKVRPIELLTPCVDLRPVDVVRLAIRLGVPLSATWSCEGEARPCGACPGCVRRREAFEQAGVGDPLQERAAAVAAARA